MNDFLLNNHGRQSARLSSWDYGSNGNYFVTICTDHKVPYFGCIDNSMLFPTEIGDYATKCWMAIPEHFPFVLLDSFVLMPDHIHGILCFGKKEKSEWTPNQFGPQIQNLAAVIRGFKGAVTSFSKVNSIKFQWQPRYFDRVIQSDQELDQIREYIERNPSNWHVNP